MAKKTREDKIRIAARVIMWNTISYNSMTEAQRIEGKAGLAAQISQTIWLIPPEFTGMISIEADRQVRDGEIDYKKLTHEHYNSRLSSGHKILEHFSSHKYDEEVLVEMLHEYSRVHLVTKEENNRLKKFTRKGHPLADASAQEQYKAANIILIENTLHTPRRRANNIVYNIHGVVYDDINHIADVYNCSAQVVRYRCFSTTKKFENWTREVSQ